jgi:hypothetical protein
MQQRHGIEAVVPQAQGRALVHQGSTTSFATASCATHHAMATGAPEIPS